MPQRNRARDRDVVHRDDAVLSLFADYPGRHFIGAGGTHDLGANAVAAGVIAVRLGLQGAQGDIDGHLERKPLF